MIIKSATAIVDFERFQGDALDIAFTWKDDNGAIIDLTAFTAELTVKHLYGDVPAAITMTESTGVTLGSGTPNVSATVDTALLDVGKYEYCVKLTSAGGKAETKLAGVIYIRKGC